MLREAFYVVGLLAATPRGITGIGGFGAVGPSFTTIRCGCLTIIVSELPSFAFPVGHLLVVYTVAGCRLPVPSVGSDVAVVRSFVPPFGPDAQGGGDAIWIVAQRCGALDDVPQFRFTDRRLAVLVGVTGRLVPTLIVQDASLPEFYATRWNPASSGAAGSLSAARRSLRSRPSPSPSSCSCRRPRATTSPRSRTPPPQRAAGALIPSTDEGGWPGRIHSHPLSATWRLRDSSCPSGGKWGVCHAPRLRSRSEIDGLAGRMRKGAAWGEDDQPHGLHGARTGVTLARRDLIVLWPHGQAGGGELRKQVPGSARVTAPIPRHHSLHPATGAVRLLLAGQSATKRQLQDEAVPRFAL